jgi:hypothetical protein
MEDEDIQPVYDETIPYDWNSYHFQTKSKVFAVPYELLAIGYYVLTGKINVMTNEKVTVAE